MTHVSSKSLIDHRERARVLWEWQLAFWWMGGGCIAIAVVLMWLDMMRHAYAMAALYWLIAAAREACGRAVERNVALVREDIREGGET